MEQEFHNVILWYIPGLLRSTVFILQVAFSQGAITDNHAVWDTDQFHVSKFYTGAFIAVVQ